MSPKACRLRHIFCVLVTPAPMLIPVRFPLIPPLATVCAMPSERPMEE
jgi:hypothetical protein